MCESLAVGGKALYILDTQAIALVRRNLHPCRPQSEAMTKVAFGLPPFKARINLVVLQQDIPLTICMQK